MSEQEQQQQLPPNVKLFMGRYVTWNGGEKFMEYVDNVWTDIGDERQKKSIMSFWSINNDDFNTYYQSNYGTEDQVEEKVTKVAAVIQYIDEKKAAELPDQVNEENDKAGPSHTANKPKKTANGKRPKGWIEFDEEKNTTIYVSNIPLSLTDEDFLKLVQTYGIIQKDPISHNLKVKLYRNEDGSLKGDGVCRYIKRESLIMALQYLDGLKVEDNELKVEEAKYQIKGEYDVTKKKRSLNAQERKKFLLTQDNQFKWKPDLPINYRPKSDLNVILKNVFSLEEIINDASLIFDIKEQLRTIFQIYGPVGKVVVYENHPEGVVCGKFSNTDQSDQAVKHLNGTLIRGRVVSADYWDGKTKYNVEEDEEQAKARMQAWDKHLAEGNDTDDEIDSKETTPEL
uniref:HIV Tat-specific factor 1 n=1 Tax=Rhabditophanes sp. KR3021 TaxID=114890 RepID=A0AC35TJ18_9BILA